MTVDDDIPLEPRKKRTRKYIPNLAEFYFHPTHDWTTSEATQLFMDTNNPSDATALDSILYEDCIQGMRRFSSNSINLVIADPPFGIDFDGKSSVYNRDESLVVEGYEEANGSYTFFTRDWIAEIPRILRDDGSVYIFSGWTNLESVLNGARKAGLSILNHIIWHYPFGVFTQRKFVTSHYHVLLLVKDTAEYFFNKLEHYPEDVWTVKRKYRAGETKNGTKLPLDVVERCIDYSSRPGDIVLDPFMGNGTTAVAAKANWRHFIGFEINRRMKRIIDAELKRTELGSHYIPYSERIPAIEELGERYPRAYKEYLKNPSGDV